MTSASFQQTFAEALRADGSRTGVSDHPAFAVYRNTVMRGCIDALEANYPAVSCLVGRDWFRSAAAIFASEEPPRDARLVAYGERFADFLARFTPASELPYLPDVARIDRLWTESYIAADAPHLDLEPLRQADPTAMTSWRLTIHPATRTFASDLPAFSIWSPSRAGEAVDGGLVWEPEAVLVTRRDHGVRVTPASPAVLSFLHACRDGLSLADAIRVTTQGHPDTRIDLLLALLIEAGAFASSRRIRSP